MQLEYDQTHQFSENATRMIGEVLLGRSRNDLQPRIQTSAAGCPARLYRRQPASYNGLLSIRCARPAPGGSGAPSRSENTSAARDRLAHENAQIVAVPGVRPASCGLVNIQSAPTNTASCPIWCGSGGPPGTPSPSSHAGLTGQNIDRGQNRRRKLLCPSVVQVD